jgi:galactosylceramidase
VLNQTTLGDTILSDYTVQTDVYFNEPYSEASLIGRCMEMNRSHKPANAYYFNLKSSGHWSLSAAGNILVSGWLPVNIQTWYTLTLSMKGNKIAASVNREPVCEVENQTFRYGQAGLGCSFHVVDFDNLHIY